MSLEKRIRDINKAYVERSLKIGGNRMIGAGSTINDFYPNKHLGIAVGGARPSLNLTPEEKAERAKLAQIKHHNKKKGEQPEEKPDEKHITKQVYKNKHNKRIEVIQTIDVKTMDDKPRKLKKTINGGKKAIKKGGYSWEKFLDDADETTQTAARVARPFLFGFGKVKGKKKGGKVEPDYSTGEPTQNLTIQHLRDKKKDIYSPLGVLLSQYTPPEQMRDRSIRPDMPLDQTEVVAPPPPPHQMTTWQAIKKAFMIIPHAVGALVGGEQPEPPKRKGKKGGNFFHPKPPKTDRQKYADEQNEMRKEHYDRLMERVKASAPTETTPAPTETILKPLGGKRGKKGGNQFKNFFEGKSQTPKPPKPSEGILTKPKTSLLSDIFKQMNEKNAQINAQIKARNAPPAPVAPPTPAPTTGAGKKPSKWVEFVKAYAKKHNMKYNEALKDSKCKSEYHNSK